MNTLPKGIRPRGNSFAVDVTFKGVRRTGTADTVEEAIVLRHALRAELRGQKPTAVLPVKPQSSWTIEKAINVTDQAAWRGRPWRVNARHHADAFAKFVGKNRTLDTIDLNTFDEWVAELESRGLSDATINRYLAPISKVFTEARDRGGVVTRPKFPRKRESQGRIRFLTTDEEKNFLDLFHQWGKEDEEDLFILLIDSGMRMSEALPFMTPEGYRDVDFKTGVMSVWRTKNDTPRSVPMTKRVRAMLERRKEDHPKSGPPQNRTPVLTKYTFRQAWDRAKSKLKLINDKQLVPHALRHTCASRLVQRGVPLKVVQEWMGHKSITVTMRYAHLAPANLLAAVKVLEE